MIVRNALKCLKCNTVIESKHRHDFVTCKCHALFVDGGKDYCRMGGITYDNRKWWKKLLGFKQTQGEGVTWEDLNEFKEDV